MWSPARGWSGPLQASCKAIFQLAASLMTHRDVISFCWLRVDESSSLLATSFCPKSARLINLFEVPFGGYLQADLAFEIEFFDNHSWCGSS
jgi:hypothetical protein